jgi:hypothetical protein
MNTTTNQSQKEQLTFTYCIGYKYEDSYDEHYDSSMGKDLDNLEEVNEEITKELLETAIKKVFKIEIWIGNADDYDEIEFKKEGKVTRAYGKKIEEEDA